MGELIWFALLKSLLPFAAYDWVWVASSLGGLRAQSAIGSAERRERNQTNPINRAKRAKQPNHQLNSLSLPPSLLRTKSGVDVLMGLSEFVLSFLSSPSSLSGLGAVGPPQRSAKRERTAREREKREQMNEAKHHTTQSTLFLQLHQFMNQKMNWLRVEWKKREWLVWLFLLSSISLRKARARSQQRKRKGVEERAASPNNFTKPNWFIPFFNLICFVVCLWLIKIIL